MKRFHSVTGGALYDQKAFDKVKIFFHLVGGWHILSNTTSNYLLQFSQNNNIINKQHLAWEILLHRVFYFSIK